MSHYPPGPAAAGSYPQKGDPDPTCKVSRQVVNREQCVSVPTLLNHTGGLLVVMK